MIDFAQLECIDETIDPLVESRLLEENAMALEIMVAAKALCSAEHMALRHVELTRIRASLDALERSMVDTLYLDVPDDLALNF